MEELKVFDTVVFDLDGTLLDTLEDLWSSTNFAMRQMGYPQRTLDEVRRFVGNGVAKLIERAVPAGTSGEDAETCLNYFREFYNEHKNDKTKPYPGIIHLLTGLKEWGYRIGVVSNKYDGAVKELCGLYFSGLVDVAVGERENVRRKPAPDSVLEAVQLLGSTVEKTVYVGDSDVDVLTAQNAGTISIGVAWGFRGEEELERAGASYLATRPYHIWSILVSRNQGIEFEASWKKSYENTVLSGAEYGMRDCGYIAQSDRRWKDVPMGETGSLQDDGCGPAALTMAVNALKGTALSLPDTAEWTVNNGYFCEGKGCYHRVVPEGGAHYGLTVEPIGADKQKLTEALKQKKMAIAVVKRGHFSGGGHFILIRGITKEGKLLIADPGSLPRSQALWDADLVLNDLSKTAGSGGPLWIVS